MKGENFGNNGSDPNKGNILKPTFDTLMEEGRKAFDAYHTVTPQNYKFWNVTKIY
jgi:hypothetical protein